MEQGVKPEGRKKMATEKCSVAVYHPGVWNPQRCSRTGKVQVDGKWYCGTHDPARIAARNEKRKAERNRESEIETYERKVREAGTMVLVAAMHWYESGGVTSSSLREAVEALRDLKEARP
jgi:hypothetical protein